MYYYSTMRLILIYRPSEGGRLSRPRHCSKCAACTQSCVSRWFFWWKTQKLVHSAGLILWSLALQASVLLLDHCDLYCLTLSSQHRLVLATSENFSQFQWSFCHLHCSGPCVEYTIHHKKLRQWLTDYFCHFVCQRRPTTNETFPCRTLAVCWLCVAAWKVVTST